MLNIREELNIKIRKLVRPLKGDEHLMSVLKVRLTKKLNQEKLKQELMV